MRSNQYRSSPASIYMYMYLRVDLHAWRHGFGPKRNHFRGRVHAGLYLDILDADRSPNPVRFHVRTTQVDFEVHHPPPAFSTRRSFDHHGKGNGNFVQKKRVSKSEIKSYLSLI